MSQGLAHPTFSRIGQLLMSIDMSILIIEGNVNGEKKCLLRLEKRNTTLVVVHGHQSSGIGSVWFVGQLVSVEDPLTSDSPQILRMDTEVKATTLAVAEGELPSNFPLIGELCE